MYHKFWEVNFLMFYFGTLKAALSGTLKFFFQEFEGIECEWPLFYTFMIIDGVFKSQSEQIEEYQNLLKSKIKRDMNGGTVCYLSFWMTVCIKNIIKSVDLQIVMLSHKIVFR
jgi:hypothetical protein